MVWWCNSCAHNTSTTLQHFLQTTLANYIWATFGGFSVAYDLVICCDLVFCIFDVAVV